MFDKYSRRSLRPQSDRWSNRLVKLPGEVENELASDLEWMLNSRQVSDEVLVEAVVGDYGQWLYWSASILIKDTANIKKVITRVVGDLLSNRKRLWSGGDAQVWLFRHTIQLSRELQKKRPGFKHYVTENQRPEKHALQNLDPKYRLPLTLRYLVGLSDEQTAQVLQIDGEEVRHRIGVVVSYLEEYRNFPQDKSRAAKDQWVQKALLESWKLPQLPRRDAHAIKSEILSRTGKRAVVGALLKRSLRVGFGVLALCLTVIILWLTNMLTPPPEAQQPQIATRLVTRVVKVPEWVTATPRPTMAKVTDAREPLSATSSLGEINSRILESRGLWDTLWVDGRIIDYGPVGYVGRPSVRREQIWIGQPYNSLVLAGWAGGSVDQIWFSLNGKVYDVDPETGEPFLYDFHSNQLPVYSTFADYLMPKSLNEVFDNYRLRTVGIGQAAGRSALILMGRNLISGEMVQFWVDIFNGMILRVMHLTSDGDTVLSEIMVRELSLDVEFPSKIFDRTDLPLHFGSDYYAELFPIKETLPDYNGSLYDTHPPKPVKTPPPGYDPTHGQVSFQWDQPPPDRSLQGTHRWMRAGQNVGPDIPVEIFSNDYFLGQLDFNPWDAACARSADGTMLALYSATKKDDQVVATLRWLDLRDLSRLEELKTVANTSGPKLALSPQGNGLVFYACLENVEGVECGLYLLDTDSGAYHGLASQINVHQIDYFLWGPQGDSVAVVSPGMVEVFDANSAQPTYSGVFSLQGRGYPKDSPLADWDVETPVISQGLEACYQLSSDSN
jgi:DNA-directed RNA polymerase specialized sigma24 family protein